MSAGGQAAFPGRDHARRSVDLRCPRCRAFQHRLLEGDLPDGLACAACGERMPFDLAAQRDEAGGLSGCPACAFPRLYVQRDFNQKLGLVVVLVTYAALLFSGLPLPWMIAGLLLLTLLDVVLLRWVVRRVVICYRCRALLRGFPPGSGCQPFDLATWEAHQGAPVD